MEILNQIQDSVGNAALKKLSEQKFPLVDSELYDRSNLTKSQLLIWTGQKLNPQMPLYNMAFAFTIKGHIQPRVFQEAFQVLINSSDTLRSVFIENNGIPRREVLKEFNYEMEYMDFSTTPDEKSAFHSWQNNRCKSLFDLEKPLFDSVLIKLEDTKYIWYLNQHHLITDGWSAALVFRHMERLYSLASKKQKVDVLTLLPYNDFVTFERARKDSTSNVKARSYWREKTSGQFTAVDFYGKTVSKESFRSDRVHYELGLDRTEKLKQVALKKEIRALTEDLSVFNVFFTILFAFLYRISGNKRISIGAPSHNRPSSAFKEIIGLFIEIYPFQITVDDGETFLSLLKKVKIESNKFLLYAQPGSGNTEFNRYSNVIFNFINSSFSSFNGFPTQSEWIHPDYCDRMHSLRLQIHDFDQSGSFQLIFDFNLEVFNNKKQQWAIDHFLRSIDAFIENPTQFIEFFPLVSENDKTSILKRFSSGKILPPTYDTMVEWFENQVQKTPGHIAIISEDQKLTYEALNSQANQLANYLIKRGVNADTFVALCAGRSVRMIVGILGILKAGGAFVPLEPTYPKHRLLFQLRDAEIGLLVTEKRYEEIFSEFQKDKILLDSQWASITSEANTCPKTQVSGTNLAYVIYTSGSTGKPKGVLVEHRHVINLVTGLIDSIYCRYDNPLNVALVASTVFDASIQQIFGALLQGHILDIISEETKMDGRLLLEFYNGHKIDVSDGTPAHLRMLVESNGKALESLSIKHFIIGGEILHSSLLKRLFKQIDRNDLVVTNIYGTAECCVDSACYEIERDRLEYLDAIPIGSPMANQKIYIVDKSMNLQPAGVVGEICIGGANVGRGYINRKDLNQEKFIKDPFQSKNRLYRTGDLGRYLEDGSIEFKGRSDSQVKVRGYRIELKEIEHCLREFKQKVHAPVSEPEANYRRAPKNDFGRCQRCIVSTKYPNIRLDQQGICNVCREFETHKSDMLNYFRPFAEFQQLVQRAKGEPSGNYDCLLLYSGGKDSSYVLYRLVNLGLKVLAFTFDNGFISKAAFENIERQTSLLNVDTIIEKTQRMNEIFVESLKTENTVCSGCFKALTTISTRIADEKKINLVVTGLSRGQIFDTKLKNLFQEGVFDVKTVEEKLLLFRKLYHSTNDRSSKLLNIDLNDVDFDSIHFVDFFRYDNTPTHEIREYLKEHDEYWSKPQDTGFCSSNCMMNDIGICVHSKEKGFHNYEGPLSWDVRLGIAERSEVIKEVEDKLNVQRVNNVLDKIGYFDKEIKDVAVVPRKNDYGELELCAYIVANQTPTVSELRSFLGESLPDYMVPAHFVQLEELPLTTNGKIDRAALPFPELGRLNLETECAPPRTATERILAKIWSEVLKIKEIGIHDNLFELGGDSIINIQIVNRASKAKLNLTPKQIFEHPTIAQLAKVAEEKPGVKAEQGIITGEVDLTPIQVRFCQQDQPNPHHWNHSVLLEAKFDFEINRLQEALHSLMIQHDMLRVYIKKSSSGWQQFINETPKTPEITQIDLSHLTTDEQDREIEKATSTLNKALNIFKGDIINVAYFHLGAGRNDRIAFNIHHLAIDGFSWAILFEDLQAAYEQLRNRISPKLVPKTTSYKQWASLLVKHAQSPEIKNELDYWLQQSDPELTTLPVDRSSTDVIVEHSLHTVSATLTREHTRSLLQEVPSVYNTQINDALLTALCKCLSEWTHSNRFLITLEGHGREEIIEGINLSRTIGWFTSLFPILLELHSNTDLGANLTGIKEQLRRIPNRGIGYGILRYLNKDPIIIGQLESKPTPQILFNYLGQIDGMVSDSAMFRLGRELVLSRSPDTKRNFLLEINAFIFKDQLKVMWTYSENFHNQATITHLSQRFIEFLQSIIAHCKTSDKRSYTPSDFPDSDLEQQELDNILAEFG